MSDKKNLVIEAAVRQLVGKSNTRKIRAAGKVPAVLNHKGKTQVLELDPKLLSKAWQGDKMFDMVLNGQTKTVKITELQINAVKRVALHVDLTYVE